MGRLVPAINPSEAKLAFRIFYHEKCSYDKRALLLSESNCLFGALFKELDSKEDTCFETLYIP